METAFPRIVIGFICFPSLTFASVAMGKTYTTILIIPLSGIDDTHIAIIKFYIEIWNIE